MLDFFYFYPNWLITIVFVGVAVAAAIALMLGLRTVLPVRDDKETFDITIRVMPAVLSLTAFVLAFAVVQAKSELARAEKIVVDEAATVGQLDRLLVRLDPATTEPTRRALAAYVRSVIDDEWPYMEQGHDGFGHTRTRGLVAGLSDSLHALDPGDGRRSVLFNDALRAADQIEDLRDARLREAREAIPALFWWIIVVLSALMMSLGAFLRPTFSSVVMVASQAAAVGLLSAFVFVLDHPFQGETRILPWMMERVASTLSMSP
ncbi:MAG: DUF4239 domain-containing protein [Rhodospirillales bacterium]|nr:DUF4239 domain-containing protein [Rhodospirillales bacterium]